MINTLKPWNIDNLYEILLRFCTAVTSYINNSSDLFTDGDSRSHDMGFLMLSMIHR